MLSFIYWRDISSSAFGFCLSFLPLVGTAFIGFRPCFFRCLLATASSCVHRSSFRCYNCIHSCLPSVQQISMLFTSASYLPSAQQLSMPCALFSSATRSSYRSHPTANAKTPMALPTSRQPLAFPYHQHSRLSDADKTHRIPTGAAAATAVTTCRDIWSLPCIHQWPAAISCSH